MIRISQLASYVFVMVEVNPIDEVGAPADPTGLTVQMGFSQKRNPSLVLPFHPAQWQVNTKPRPPKYYVMAPIGADAPAGTLWAGVWWPVAKILAPPETITLVGEAFRVDGEVKPAVQTKYAAGTSLPDMWVEWRDGNNKLVPFGTEASTFELTLWNRLAPLSVVLDKVGGFVSADTNPNLKVIWAPGEISSLPPGVYDGQIVATRTSDSKTRQVAIEIEIE